MPIIRPSGCLRFRSYHRGRTMPKIVDHTEIRGKRLQKQENLRKSNTSSAFVSLRVLGNGAPGQPASVLLITDHLRYLFNCGEGTQRLANEHRYRLSKVEQVFFTRSSWSHYGGVIGMALTAQEMGVPSLTLHGPPHIDRLFEMSRGFIQLKELEICKQNLAEGYFHDSFVKIEYIPLFGKVKTKPEHQEEPQDVIENIDQDYTSTRGNNDSTQPVTKRPRLETADFDREISISYIGKPTSKAGRLLLEKCLDAGVPAGPLLGQLKNGKDITLPNGTVVRSADVCEPEEPGKVFIIVDCPDEEFLESLVRNEKFRNYQTEGESAAQVIVHFAPSNIIQDPKYQHWIFQFPKTTHHIILNETCRSPTSFAVHRIQFKLNMLHPYIFPLLTDDMKTVPQLTEENTFLGEPLMQYNLRPSVGVDRSGMFELTPEEFVQECHTQEGFTEALEQFRSSLPVEQVHDNSQKYPHLVFLGTGSSIPSKVRNTSAIVLRLTPIVTILLDCSEGTYQQIVRFYGASGASELLRSLTAVYISHLHADHHLGLIQIMQARQKSISEAEGEYLDKHRLHLIAPYQIQYWLTSYDVHFEPIQHLYQLHPCTAFLQPAKQTELHSLLQLESLETTFVKHCRFAFGIALTHRDGWKMVYSGDTMPCQNLVNIGRDCDVLIHEATMEDELAHEAVIKKHSTTSQAIDVGKKMNAKFILLTHFSQRYAKVPIFNENFDKNVGIAFDNMRICLDDLPVLPLFNTVLRKMFAEQYEEMKEKTAKILRREKLEEELSAIKS